jgi:hypothetical protein
MAIIKGQITLNEVELIEISGDPSISGGTPSPKGSLALDDTGKLWVKTGDLDTDWGSAGSGTVYADDVLIRNTYGAPTDSLNVQDWLDSIWSVGVITGGNITDNGNGTVNISSATAILRQMHSVSIVRSGSVATVTQTAHGYEDGDYIYIEGANQSEYNGTYTIYSVTANTYSYTISGTPVTPATGTIYATNDHDSLIPSLVPAITNLSLVDNKTNYIYATQDGGATFSSTTSFTVLGVSNKALIYTIARQGNTLYIIDERSTNVDAIRKTKARSLETETFKVVLGGSILGDAGTRHISVTAGAFYHGIQKISHNAFNTSTGDVFRYCYRNGSGGWTYTTGNTQISNSQYDNGTGTLHNLSGQNYGVFWVYMMNNEPSSLLVQYGQNNYSNVAAAQAALVPTPPDIVLGVGVLLGRIIIRQGASTFETVDLAVVTTFQPTVASNHENLAGLLGGAANDHQHLTTAQLAIVDATSGVNTGDQTSVSGNSGTTTAALGLKTATTTVAISTAAAPTAGQVLTAISTTAATWQTPSGGVINYQIDGGVASSVYGGTTGLDGGGA